MPCSTFTTGQRETRGPQGGGPTPVRCLSPILLSNPRVPMPAARAFNEVVQMDVKQLRDRQMQHTVEVATMFQISILVNGGTTRELSQTLRQGWLAWAGKMLEDMVDLVTDMASEEVTETYKARGVQVESRSAGARHALGCQPRRGVPGISGCASVSPLGLISRRRGCETTPRCHGTRVSRQPVFEVGDWAFLLAAKELWSSKTVVTRSARFLRAADRQLRPTSPAEEKSTLCAEVGRSWQNRHVAVTGHGEPPAETWEASVARLEGCRPNRTDDSTTCKGARSARRSSCDLASPSSQNAVLTCQNTPGRTCGRSRTVMRNVLGNLRR